MKKIAFTIFLLLITITNANLAFADNAPQCEATWNQSSAAATCGYVCTNPQNVYSYPFSSSYNAEKDECTFNAGCCEGLPFQICSYDYAVCDPSAITVKKGDSKFQNDHGKFKHD